eukprot:1399238-Rhodomonas_salina.1
MDAVCIDVVVAEVEIGEVDARGREFHERGGVSCAHAVRLQVERGQARAVRDQSLHAQLRRVGVEPQVQMRQQPTLADQGLQIVVVELPVHVVFAQIQVRDPRALAQEHREVARGWVVPQDVVAPQIEVHQFRAGNLRLCQQCHTLRLDEIPTEVQALQLRAVHQYARKQLRSSNSDRTVAQIQMDERHIQPERHELFQCEEQLRVQ